MCSSDLFATRQCVEAKREHRIAEDACGCQVLAFFARRRVRAGPVQKLIPEDLPGRVQNRLPRDVDSFTLVVVNLWCAHSLPINDSRSNRHHRGTA